LQSDGCGSYELWHAAITGWVKHYAGAIAQKEAGHASFKTTERNIQLSDDSTCSSSRRSRKSRLA
jgi:hypothetical protein